MSGRSDVSELTQVFVPGMHQKLDELNEVLDVLLEEGPNPSAIEVVYRASFSLKSLATAFEQQEMVEFIAHDFDTLLNRVRIRAEKPSPGVKASFRNFVEKLRHMVDALAPADAPKRPADAPHAREDNPQILAAIGQMSIWSFHDITNYLAKLQGYAEMIEDCRATLAEGKTDGSNELAELAVIQSKIAENVNSIAASVARIRMARGKVPSKAAPLELEPLIADLMRTTLFSKYNVSWATGSFPQVKLEQDRTLIELVWVSLWRLLAEWLPPDTAARAKCEARVVAGSSENASQPYPDRLSIHFWLEPRAEEPSTLALEKIHFGQETPRVDLGGIFRIVSQAASTRGLCVEVGTTPQAHPIFRLDMPCGLASPQEPKTSDAQRAPHRELEPMAKDAARPYILVVDDERDLRSLLQVKLAKLGYPVIAVESIAEARGVLQREKVSLVLADLFLSQESGLDLLREVRANRPDLAFLFMSGANEDDVPAAILKVLSMYANAFLRKPIPTSTLKETIEKFYGGTRPGVS